MKLARRRFLRLAAGTVALPAVSQIARAQAYPLRPVRLLVGFAPGGAADIVARLMGQWLSERLGQQVFVENRPGAGSNIAAEAAAKAPADGYTLFQATISNAFNATLYDKLTFDLNRDLAPVASIMRTASVLQVHPSVPARTGSEFIAYAKANPGKVNMASAGPGSAPHLYGELLKMMAGLDLTQVHYRGSGPALTDLISGQVQVMIDPIVSSIEHIRSGKLRPLGVTAASRMEMLPDVPPIGEFVPGFEASGWQGIAAPAKAPTEIVESLNREVNAGLADPKFKLRLAQLGAVPFVSSPADFGKFIATETEKWRKVIRTANIKAE